MKLVNAWLAVVILLVGCASTSSEPLDTSEIEEFIDDSEYMIEILETAYWDGFRELTYEEEREAISYAANYDKDSDFQERADDPTISLIVTNISMMELLLGNTGTVVGDNNPKSEYVEYRTEAEKDISEARENYIESGDDSGN
ncbi:hypothetical protein ACQCVK_02850 [Rossellomorea vietnamensis]|uniref:hypothetical protein n=1 Tax=Rossellomorea vietnamensis TaxID=218284 RepID=UPI003CF2EDAE